MSNSVVKRTWDRLRTYPPEQLKPKSSSCSSLKRARTLLTIHSCPQP